MRFLVRLLLQIVILFALFNTKSAFCQQLSDEVYSKLSEADQKKITKSDDLILKGDLKLSKAGYPGDKQMLEMLSMGETKELKKFAGERFLAASTYKEAHAGKFAVYEKNCKDFWNKFTGNKTALKEVKDAEDKAILQYKDAQELRKTVEKNKNTSERISGLIEVETNEKSALSMLQKTLYVYQNYPVAYDQNWFQTTSATPQKSIEATPLKEGNVTYNELPPVIAQPVIAVPETTQKPENVVKQEPEKKKITDNEQFAQGDSSLYMLVDVNEDQIDKFNSFLQRTYPNTYESYIIDFQNIDYTNLQALRDSWYKYRYGTPSQEGQQYIADSQTPADTSAKMGVIEEIIAQDISEKTQKQQQKSQTTRTDIASQDTQPYQTPITEVKENGKTTTAKQKTKDSQVTTTKETADVATTKTYIAETKATPGKSIKITSEPIAKGFLFKVQIAASRVPLNESVLQGIYQGNEKITETFEDNWYKYTIGEFNTYKQARYLRDETPVPGVFVVAYLNGNRIRITPSVVAKRQIADEFPIDGIEPGKIEFRLQIAASQVPLDNATLKDIYNGNQTIDTIEEDGWYKYSILAGNKLTHALELLNTINVPGAFVVTYYNNQKINLHTAIKLTKNN